MVERDQLRECKRGRTRGLRGKRKSEGRGGDTSGDKRLVATKQDKEGGEGGDNRRAAGVKHRKLRR